MSTYAGRPYLKAPVWKWPVPAYFFTGGLAAGTSLVATAARLTGDDRLARRCLLASLGATAVSTGLLVEDLGRPERFLNMLRVAKPTSPMSVGTWVLAGFGGATAVAVLSPDPAVARVAERVAAALAPVLATYTAVLIADTAVPAWHEARRELPFVFAGGALASGGGLAMVLSPSPPARRAGVAGAALALVAARIMERRLVPTRPLSRWAALTTLAGALLAGSAGRGDCTRTAAGVLLLVGAAAERFAVFQAGVESTGRPPAAG